MEEIKFKDHTSFIGRNGMFKASALNLIRDSFENLLLTPITSRGQFARCEIIVHEDSVVEMVEAIKKLYPDKFKEQERIERAANYLCESEDKDGKHLSVADQVKLILEYKGNHNDLIDDIDGVCVAHFAEYDFTVKSFCNEVLY